jgi:hypothetical protein
LAYALLKENTLLYLKSNSRVSQVRWRWALLDHTRRLAPCRLRTTFAPVNVFSLINPWVLNSLLREIRNAIVPLLHVKHGRHWKTNHQTESDEKTSAMFGYLEMDARNDSKLERLSNLYNIEQRE